MILLKNNDNIKDLLVTLNNIQRTLSFDEENKLIISFQDTDFFNLSVLAILTNWIDFIKKQGYNISIQIDGLYEKCVQYASRMDFFKLIGYNYKENFLRHNEEGKFFPIRMIEQYDSNLITELTKIFANKFNFDKDSSTLYMLDYSLNELIENIDRHSRTKYLSTVVSQSYPKLKKIELCIIDNGIGIPNALRKTLEYKDWTDQECLRKCTYKNIKTKSTKNEGQGNGLYTMKRFVEETNGSFCIYSGNSLYEYNPCEKIDETKEIVGMWQGTIINIIIYTDHIFEVKTVIDVENYEPFSPVIDEIFG